MTYHMTISLYLHSTNQGQAYAQLDDVEPENLRTEACHNFISSGQWRITVAGPERLKLFFLVNYIEKNGEVY